MRVKEIMDKKHPFIYYDELLTKARAIIRDFALRILPAVNENKKLLGIVSRRDVMAISSSVSPIKVIGTATPSKCIATMEDDATFTIRKMTKLDEWYAPVVNSAQDQTYRGVLGLENFIEASLKTTKKEVSEPVSAIMSKEVVTCSPDDEVDNIWRIMQKQSFAGLPVVRRDKVVGMVTQKDLLESGAILPTFESKKGRFQAASKVSSIMKTTVTSAKPSTDIREVAKLMISKNIGRVPVENDKKRLIGIIDREDVVKFLT